MAKNLVPVQYVGRHPAVEVDPDGMGEITVVLGQVIKVAEEVAGNLIQQVNNWRIPESKPAVKSTINAEEAK